MPSAVVYERASGLTLTLRAPIARALTDHEAPDRHGANPAGLSLAAINHQILLEVTGFAARVDEIAQRGAASDDRYAQYLANRIGEPGIARAADAPGRGPRPYAGAEQG